MQEVTQTEVRPLPLWGQRLSLPHQKTCSPALQHPLQIPSPRTHLPLQQTLLKQSSLALPHRQTVLQLQRRAGGKQLWDCQARLGLCSSAAARTGQQGLQGKLPLQRQAM